jgi:hypothetical protein
MIAALTVIVCLVIISISLFSMVRILRDLRKYSKPVEAMFLSFVSSTTQPPLHKQSLYYNLVYTVNGVEYNKTYATTVAKSEGKHTIFVDPHNPNDYRVDPVVGWGPVAWLFFFILLCLLFGFLVVKWARRSSSSPAVHPSG